MKTSLTVSTTVNISLDGEKFTTKPIGETLVSIQNRITKGITNSSIETLANVIGNTGRTFCSCTFKQENVNPYTGYIPRTISNFKSQQLFALDFDKDITWDEVNSRADRYNLPITFAYETFSSVECSKFRVIFCHEFEVIHNNVAKMILLALQVIFPECDSRCIEVAHLFFGGKNLLYINKNDNNILFNVNDLMIEMVRCLQDKYGKHYTRYIDNFATLSGICLINGIPKVLVEDIYNDCDENDASLEGTPIELPMIPPNK